MRLTQSLAEFLIQHNLVHTIWSPLVEWTRLRHLKFRRRLAEKTESNAPGRLRAESIVSAGV